jgi:hypothetical protein
VTDDLIFSVLCCSSSLSSLQFTKKPVKVVVTGAAGNIAYAILFQIGQGKLLGDDQPIELRLLDIPQMSNAITGVIMELQVTTRTETTHPSATMLSNRR